MSKQVVMGRSLSYEMPVGYLILYMVISSSYSYGWMLKFNLSCTVFGINEIVGNGYCHKTAGSDASG